MAGRSGVNSAGKWYSNPPCAWKQPNHPCLSVSQFLFLFLLFGAGKSLCLVCLLFSLTLTHRETYILAQPSPQLSPAFSRRQALQGAVQLVCVHGPVESTQGEDHHGLESHIVVPVPQGHNCVRWHPCWCFASKPTRHFLFSSLVIPRVNCCRWLCLCWGWTGLAQPICVHQYVHTLRSMGKMRKGYDGEMNDKHQASNFLRFG